MWGRAISNVRRGLVVLAGLLAIGIAWWLFAEDTRWGSDVLAVLVPVAAFVLAIVMSRE